MLKYLIVLVLLLCNSDMVLYRCFSAVSVGAAFLHKNTEPIKQIGVAAQVKAECVLGAPMCTRREVAQGIYSGLRWLCFDNLPAVAIACSNTTLVDQGMGPACASVYSAL